MFNVPPLVHTHEYRRHLTCENCGHTGEDVVRTFRDKKLIDRCADEFACWVRWHDKFGVGSAK